MADKLFVSDFGEVAGASGIIGYSRTGSIFDAIWGERFKSEGEAAAAAKNGDMLYPLPSGDYLLLRASR